MLRWVLGLLLMIQVLQAETKYFIQFGSFKNLKGLEKSIANLPSGLRSHVVIVRSNSWYIPFAYYTSNKQALKPKLSSYKRYFKDAHIAHSSYMLNHPLVRNYATKVKQQKRAATRAYIPAVTSYAQQPQRVYIPPVRKAKPRFQNVAISEEDYTTPYVQPNQSAVQQPVEEPIVTHKVVRKKVEENDVFSNIKPKKYKKFSKQMLSGQHYYLAYKKSESNPDLLIKVSFGNHKVTYQPVIGDMTMTKANYLTEGDRLYMFTDTFSRNGSFSRLEEHRENHFLVSSWANGKKLNTLRYYYKLNDAKRYLGLDTSDGLAEILSEGDYDDFFLDE